MDRIDVIVVGQGYAGLVATREAAEAGLRVATVEGMMPGGLIMSINELDPAPEGGEVGGPEFTSNIAMENMDRGVEGIMDMASAITQGADGWTVETGAGTYTARAVIIATGAKLRKLGVPGEEEFFGRGVSECADCDGPLYMGKEVVVVGGGDSAYQEALALCHYASKVTILQRGAAPRARADLVTHVANNPKIEVITGTTVDAILGDASVGVTGVSVTGPDGARTIPTVGVFAYIGLDPVTELLPAEIARDEAGAAVTDADGQTTLSGLWVIGAARSGFGGLLTDAEIDARRTVVALSKINETA